jgi:hypothetical protein
MLDSVAFDTLEKAGYLTDGGWPFLLPHLAINRSCSTTFQTPVQPATGGNVSALLSALKHVQLWIRCENHLHTQGECESPGEVPLEEEQRAQLVKSLSNWQAAG